MSLNTLNEIEGFPYFELELNKEGELVNDGDPAREVERVRSGGITDLLVMSHGWKNDIADARGLYAKLLTSMRALLDHDPDLVGSDRILAATGIFWPSKKYTDRDLIPGGAASASGEDEDEEIAELLEGLEEFYGTEEAGETIARVRKVIDGLDSEEAMNTFADLVRGLEIDTVDRGEDGADLFFSLSGAEILKEFAEPVIIRAQPGGEGGAAGGVGGGAAGFRDLGRGAKSSSRRFLNQFTYYVMKARAGKVGAGGVAQFVAGVKDAVPALRVHLVGHSFGGRLVTAATHSLGENQAHRPHSLSLLQAAFSHNGFAEDPHRGKDGFFRTVMSAQKVNGPLLVTHTLNDKANAALYPLASRLARQDASAAEQPSGGRFGAIGANGARDTPEAIDLDMLSQGSGSYGFQPHRLYNLQSDDFIPNHNEVTGLAVAHAILDAVEST